MMRTVLEAREDRWNRRKALASGLGEGWSVLSFTLRLPVFLRLERRYEAIAGILFDDLLIFLREKGIESGLREFAVRGDGPEGMCTVRGNPQEVKIVCVEFEETHPWGALADVDIMDREQNAEGRSQIGLPPRTCLVCLNPAAECVSGRIHSEEEIKRKVDEILGGPPFFPPEGMIRHISGSAGTALLLEAAAAPKPGLVDPYSRGAHDDMDYFTFLASASALASWWEVFVRMGRSNRGKSPESLFPELRKTGLRAEKTMFAATKGINTHKGLIFSLGVLCAAAGLLAAEGRHLSAENCASCGASIVKGIVEKDFSGIENSPADTGALTAGEKLFLSQKTTGIRGEAERGFPSVLHSGLPELVSGIQAGLSLNDAMINSLLSLMLSVEDTNILSRGGKEGQDYVRKTAGEALNAGGMASEKGKEAVRKMDTLFSEKKLSPGGSADLLAVTVFLYLLTQASG